MMRDGPRHHPVNGVGGEVGAALFRPHQQPIAVRPDVVDYHRRLIAFEIRAGDAKPLEVQSGSADRILRSRAFQLEEPERHIGGDQPLFSQLINEYAKAPNWAPCHFWRLRPTHYIALMVERQQGSGAAQTRADLRE